MLVCTQIKYYSDISLVIKNNSNVQGNVANNQDAYISPSMLTYEARLQGNIANFFLFVPEIFKKYWNTETKIYKK